MGEVPRKVMVSPGHTLASITYAVGDVAFVQEGFCTSGVTIASDARLPFVFRLSTEAMRISRSVAPDWNRLATGVFPMVGCHATHNPLFHKG